MGSRTRRERSASKSCVMDRRTPLALLETRGRLITEATYFPTLLEGCAAQTLPASGLQAPVTNVRFGPNPAVRRPTLEVRPILLEIIAFQSRAPGHFRPL